MKIINKTVIIAIVLPTFFLTGCISQFFSVGVEKSRCDEIGCDYTDVGVCANPIEILQNKNDLRQIKLRNEMARKAKDEQSFF